MNNDALAIAIVNDAHQAGSDSYDEFLEDMIASLVYADFGTRDEELEEADDALEDMSDEDHDNYRARAIELLDAYAAL